MYVDRPELCGLFLQRTLGQRDIFQSAVLLSRGRGSVAEYIVSAGRNYEKMLRGSSSFFLMILRTPGMPQAEASVCNTNLSEGIGIVRMDISYKEVHIY